MTKKARLAHCLTSTEANTSGSYQALYIFKPTPDDLSSRGTRGDMKWIVTASTPHCRRETSFSTANVIANPKLPYVQPLTFRKDTSGYELEFSSQWCMSGHAHSTISDVTFSCRSYPTTPRSCRVGFVGSMFLLNRKLTLRIFPSRGGFLVKDILNGFCSP